MDLIYLAVAVLGGVIVGIALTFVVKGILNSRSVAAAQSEAEVIRDEVSEERRVILLEAKEESHQIRRDGETEIKERRAELQGSERRLANREENADRRASNLERREKRISQRESDVDKVQLEIEEIKNKQAEKLESVADLSVEEAKHLIMIKAEDDAKYELAAKYRDIEDQHLSEANEKARNILGQAIQRLASDVVSESTLSSVPLPNDDMKGRLIGREGRNIRAIERNTGVDLIIDDTPEAVTLSCFDPVRRETARLAVSKLVADGRIHPARIEDMVKKAEKEVTEVIWQSGQEAVMDSGVRGLSPDIIRLMGRLKYRYSYGENVLMHCLEVSHLAGMLAAEVGADVKIAKAGGFLHDIGKALSHEIEGPHAEIGADIAKKYNVPSHVCRCIAEHHDDEMSSPESFIVAAADAISAARPGSRKDTVENYVKRLEALEEVASGFDGVEKCFAIQAGREVRIMVEPENIDDVEAASMARAIVKSIEDKLVYPGQIKVIVIREKRTVEYAR